jgi:Reverse transcriptase (RNA-dependent DNA polymerase)
LEAGKIWSAPRQCIGPILFLIFIGDLDEAATPETIVKKLADDATLGQVLNKDSDHAQLQLSLNNMNAWARKWGMQFNATKCKVMHIGCGNPMHSTHLDEHQLEETVLERDIGVLLSRSLKPGDKCEKAAKKATTVLGQVT